MGTSETVSSGIQVEVENIGGIAETAVEFSPGVTVLAGRNATNRTSFLRAVMAALGSENVALKGDAESGSVALTHGGETYTRRLDRRDGTVAFGGEPYLDEPEVADLFAFLLEANPARRAVERGDDLYDVIMRPVDTDELEAELDRLEAERERLADELAALEELEGQLPELEAERTEVGAELEETRAELEAEADELEALEADASSEDAEETFEALREARHRLEAVRADVEDEAQVIEALREDREALEADLDGLAQADAASLEELEATIDRHRESVRAIESTVNELQSVIRFNESLLDGPEVELVGNLQADEGAGDGSVTDQLVADGDELVCWTCGSQVGSDQVEQTVELLREVHAEKVERRSELRAEIDELEAERSHIERTREERERLSRELETVEAELAERTDRLEALETEADELEAEVEALEAAVDDLAEDDRDERLERHRRVNELEFEAERLADRLEAVEAEIASIEDRLAEREALEAQREAVLEEIEAGRSRIERLETEAVEQFNDRMDRILELLEFENLERVWIERVETAVTEGRRTVTKPTFDLHVVRTAESGSVYEDTVDHLSESEREVVGLVFALSGYLVHDVHEQVPFMLLDSLEALDAERIAGLVDYLAEQAPNLVVALLPDDAAALDDDYERVTAI